MPKNLKDHTYLPSQGLDDEFVEMCQALASQALADPDSRPRLVMGSKTIDLPPQVAEILGQVVAAMCDGLAVTVAPQTRELSTQQAADLLGISRPTLVRLLEEGEIPFMKARRHRRVMLADILEFQKRQRHQADQALADIVADAQAYGDYDHPNR
ncbi:helix-turn-helix domain-containing protein [Acidipropionibacterium jensenii]|nr:helix-turn-helix domain-containing protein [Acidipropionibacterium jensenii]MDN6618090.1 helix-turn-helix domain-containing protein [Corynebacterium variabile]MDN5976629.1 helix-turn-helix domain-containing protein [Acidipropionibacterium jensenii]MDN5995720.1 helix-turn-helix domain-containing protein [Acidipropionibacterium jensenii]MDN6021892.1 helix-turn-helix domain-containing protein [Acidipropionibacterium jensenii]MDN6426725.1 helix-turn-helix domain-containing protein [Acidipropion